MSERETWRGGEPDLSEPPAEPEIRDDCPDPSGALFAIAVFLFLSIVIAVGVKA